MGTPKESCRNPAGNLWAEVPRAGLGRARSAAPTPAASVAPSPAISEALGGARSRAPSPAASPAVSQAPSLAPSLARSQAPSPALTRLGLSLALGHSRGRVYRGSTLAAQDAPASSLCDSSGRLLLWQHSGGVPQPAHPSRSPQPRYACARRPAGEGLYRLSASGADAVVSGPYCCTHLHC